MVDAVAHTHCAVGNSLEAAEVVLLRAVRERFIIDSVVGLEKFDVVVALMDVLALVVARLRRNQESHHHS